VWSSQHYTEFQRYVHGRGMARRTDDRVDVGMLHEVTGNPQPAVLIPLESNATLQHPEEEECCTVACQSEVRERGVIMRLRTSGTAPVC
jgi:hypothetical protein